MKSLETSQKAGYCAIVLCFLFGILTILGLLYLYHIVNRVRDEQDFLKRKSLDFVRADQIAAVVETSEPLQKIQTQQAQQTKHMNDLSRRLEDLIALEHRQTKKHQELLGNLGQQQQQLQQQLQRVQNPSSDEEEPQQVTQFNTFANAPPEPQLSANNNSARRTRNMEQHSRENADRLRERVKNMYRRSKS
jgi:hypothetical protein